MPLPPRAVLVALLGLPPAIGCGLDPLVDTDLGDAPRCAEVDRWLAASANDEDLLLDAIDALRLTGAECGGETVAGVGPLEPLPTLQCAARLHAGDLIRNPQLAVDHPGSDGSTALSRANASGYDGIARQELLAGDFTSADALIGAWLDSEIHCRALLDDSLDHIGVAQARAREGDRIVWVVVTGQERR
ncbi:MAG: CAP domain-containing protein [Nannocystaceae bacterium]